MLGLFAYHVPRAKRVCRTQRAFRVPALFGFLRNRKTPNKVGTLNTAYEVRPPSSTVELYDSYARFSRSVFNAPPQAITWSSMLLTDCAC